MTFLYHKLSENFRGIFPESTVIFPEISGKIPKEISGNFPTFNPRYCYFAIILLLLLRVAGVLTEHHRRVLINMLHVQSPSSPSLLSSMTSLTYWIYDVTHYDVITIIIVLVCFVCNVSAVTSHLIYSLEVHFTDLNDANFNRKQVNNPVAFNNQSTTTKTVTI